MASFSSLEWGNLAEPLKLSINETIFVGEDLASVARKVNSVKLTDRDDVMIYSNTTVYRVKDELSKAFHLIIPNIQLCLPRRHFVRLRSIYLVKSDTL